MNARLIDQLERHEGLRLQPYLCPAGKLTIGYGRNLEARGITAAEAEMLLENDIRDVSAQLRRRVNGFAALAGTPRGDVLVNMAFNLGIGGLLEFQKMLKAVEAGNFARAADEMLASKWAKQVPNRARELSEQMRTGVYFA